MTKKKKAALKRWEIKQVLECSEGFIVEAEDEAAALEAAKNYMGETWENQDAQVTDWIVVGEADDEMI